MNQLSSTIIQVPDIQDQPSIFSRARSFAINNHLNFKLTYLLLYMAMCSVSFFKMKFFKDVLGITEHDASLIYTASFVLTAAGSVFWNYLADKFERPKLVLIFTSTCMASIFQLFQLLKYLPIDHKSSFQIFIILLWTFCYSGMQPLMDGICIRYLSKHGGRELFGQQRLFGSLGFGTVTVLAARCIDAGKATTKEEVKDAYMPLYYIIAIITGFLVISLIFLIGSDESYKKETESIKNVKDIEKDQPQPQIQEATPIIPKQKQLYTLLTTSSFVYVLLLSLTIGFSNSIYSMLRGIYVEEMILFMSPNKKLIASLTAITGMAFEVIIYFFGKSLLTKFGAFTMLSISLIMICARSWGYFFIPESEQYIWVIFILELFCRGVCIGSFSISSVHIASQVAGPDLQATAQGLVHAVVNGLAGILGSVVSAVVLKVTASYKVVFLVASVAPSVAFLGLVVFKWFEWVGSRKCK